MGEEFHLSKACSPDDSKILSDHILQNVKIYYDAGAVIASSVVLLVVYSMEIRKFSLILGIPILIALGEFFYLHLVHMIMLFEYNLIEIRSRDNNTLTLRIGIFRNLFEDKKKLHIPYSFHIRKWGVYLVGYVVFCIGSLAINVGRTTVLTINPIDLWILNFGKITIDIIPFFALFYFLIFLVLAAAIRYINKEYNQYLKNILVLKPNLIEKKALSEPTVPPK